ncbi:MAG: hypothetical protein HC824_10475, partial [Synechococcales cyanobacterium RM1_1_8]|nr:hypothetical protein [Synechococcales cyanobacterium RM1_1_8]
MGLLQRSGAIAKVAGSTLLREAGQGLIGLSDWLAGQTREAEAAEAASLQADLDDRFSGTWQRWGQFLAQVKAPLPKPLRRLSDTRITGILAGLLVFLLLALSSLFSGSSVAQDGLGKTVAVDQIDSIQAPLTRPSPPGQGKAASKLVQSRRGEAPASGTAPGTGSAMGTGNPEATEPAANPTEATPPETNPAGIGQGRLRGRSSSTGSKSLSAAEFFGEETGANQANQANQAAIAPPNPHSLHRLPRPGPAIR